MKTRMTTLLDQTNLKSAEEMLLWKQFTQQQHAKVKSTQKDWVVEPYFDINLKEDEEGPAATINLKYPERSRVKNIDEDRRDYYPDETLRRSMTIGKELGSGSHAKTMVIDSEKKYDSVVPRYKHRLIKIVSELTLSDKNNADSLEFDTRQEAKRLTLIPDFHAKDAGYTVRDTYYNGKKISLDEYTLVMRRFEGETLEAFLKKPRTAEQCLQLSINLLNALQVFHDYKIAHLDLKPANIIVDPNTLEVKFIDLGLSKEFSELKTLRYAVGSLLYVAPEGFKEKTRDDEIILDARSDLFSMGMVFIKLWGGVSSRDAMPNGNQIVANLESPAYYDDFVNLFSQLVNLEFLDAKQKNEIESCIKQMIRQDQNERIKLEEAIQAFEAIDLCIKLKASSVENKLSFSTAYKIGGDTCRSLKLAECQKKPEKYILDLVLKSLHKEQTWNFEAVDWEIYLERLKVNCLRECNSNEEIKFKLKVIYEQFNQNEQSFSALQTKVHELAKQLKQSPHDNILEPFLHQILRDVDSLERKIQKYRHTIDGWDYVNAQFSEKIKKINEKLDFLEPRIEWDSTAVLKSILKLDVEEQDSDDELTALKSSVKSAMAGYIDKKGGKVSTTRLADMQRVTWLLDHCKKKEEVPFLINTLRHQASHFPTGFFGRSQLRDKIEEIVSSVKLDQSRNA